MKKIFGKAFVTMLAVMLATGTGYAWIKVTEAQNSVTRSVQVSVDEASNGKLLMGEKATALGEGAMRSTGTAELKPCTSEDGVTFRNESGDKVSTGYTDSYTVYIKSGDTNHALAVRNVIIGGFGAEDAITDALRVAVTYGGETKVYDRTSSFDDVFSLAVSNKDATALTVTVWYEGTDDSCTAENALDNSGSVSVKVVLGMV